MTPFGSAGGAGGEKDVGKVMIDHRHRRVFGQVAKAGLQRK